MKGSKIKKLKIKDFVMIALLTALYMLFYMVASLFVFVLGDFGHAISPGICGLLSGAVLVFMTRKVGKFGQFTIMQAICMVIFSIMGAGYLPWFITSMVGAILADIIASTTDKPATWKVGIASGLFHVGQAFGTIIPCLFFLESYREEWISRGQTEEAMDAMIKYTSGAMGIVSTIIVFTLSFIGVYIGYAILKKHLENSEASKVEKEAEAIS
ncbi:MAG: MptD family putative ECF transporter S component [Eubacterium sp.]|nr:MptD family putative ECF transporter S component [Eubacterium sp.]